jgi:hypothetical protein
VSQRETARILRKLVDLARKAETRAGGISMADVFDDENDAEAWRRAWEEARRVVYETS